MFAMAKLMKIKTTEQNKVTLYLFNIRLENYVKLWYNKSGIGICLVLKIPISVITITVALSKKSNNS